MRRSATTGRSTARSSSMATPSSGELAEASKRALDQSHRFTHADRDRDPAGDEVLSGRGVPSAVSTRRTRPATSGIVIGCGRDERIRELWGESRVTSRESESGVGTQDEIRDRLCTHLRSVFGLPNATATRDSRLSRSRHPGCADPTDRMESSDLQEAQRRRAQAAGSARSSTR